MMIRMTVKITNTNGKLSTDLYIKPTEQTSVSFKDDDRAFSLLHQESPQIWYYASLSTCCQNREKMGSPGKFGGQWGSNF